MVWCYSINDCLKMAASVDYASWEYWKDADRVGDQMLVRGREAYLLDEYTGEILAGLYAWITVDGLQFRKHSSEY